ncbi:MAG: hypothetical protein WC966_10940 [Bradymonadales bacterium]|jgi:hypothetical protein
MSSALRKITIVCLEGGPNIVAEFNPKELSFNKAVEWSDDSQGIATDFPALQFTSGKAIKLSVELLFDRFETGGDVRGIVESVMNLAIIKKELKRPPMVKLVWAGSDVLYTGGVFTGVVNDVTTKYTMFTDNGVPCRAVVSISMTQAEEAYGASDGGADGGGDKVGHKVFNVGDNPTLADIQNKYPDDWGKIVEGVDDPSDPAQLKKIVNNGTIITKVSKPYEAPANQGDGAA